jgi:FkbM family methyltransferase
MKWIDDFVLRIYPCNEVFRSIFVRGIYDPNLVATVNTLLPKGGVLMDVGANMGYVSILASQIIGKEGHIFAIEPSSRDFSRLKDNVRINRLDDVISCYNFAVSEKNGRAKLLIAGEERSALNTLGSEISFKGVEEIGVEEVETSTLDSFVEKAGIKRVDVLKMDVEGSELKALQGARNTIETYRPAIILGVNRNALKSCGTDYPELQKMIGEIRYYAYKIVEKPTFALEKIKDLSKNYVGNVVCLHESVVPPILPQPEKRSIWDGISYFFLR